MGLYQEHPEQGEIPQEEMAMDLYGYTQEHK
jgi:hypothetical protein